MPNQFDVAGALKAGYTAAQIADYLGKDSGFDVAGARKAGYKDDEILDHLAKSASPAAAPEGAFGRAARVFNDPEGGVLPAVGSLIDSALPKGGGKRGVGGAIKDTAIDLAQGAVQLGQGVVGLGSLITGGALGDGLAKLGYDTNATQQFLAGLYTEDRLQAERNVQESEGFLGRLAALGVNPSALIGRIVQSAPAMLAAGGAAGAFARAALPKATAAAEAAGLTGTAANEFVAKEVALAATRAAAGAEGAISAGNIAEGGREAGSGWGTYAPAALLGGTLTAAVGLGSAAVANKLGIGDIETDIAMRGVKTEVAAASKVAAKSRGNMLTRAGKEGLKEGLLEELPQSAGEAIAGNLAEGKPWDEQVLEQTAEGALVGSVFGGAHGAISPKRELKDQEEMARLAAAKSVDEAIAAANALTAATTDLGAAVSAYRGEAPGLIDEAAQPKQDTVVDPTPMTVEEAKQRLTALRDDPASPPNLFVGQHPSVPGSFAVLSTPQLTTDVRGVTAAVPPVVKPAGAPAPEAAAPAQAPLPDTLPPVPGAPTTPQAQAGTPAQGTGAPRSTPAAPPAAPSGLQAQPARAAEPAPPVSKAVPPQTATPPKAPAPVKSAAAPAAQVVDSTPMTLEEARQKLTEMRNAPGAAPNLVVGKHPTVAGAYAVQSIAPAPVAGPRPAPQPAPKVVDSTPMTLAEAKQRLAEMRDDPASPPNLSVGKHPTQRGAYVVQSSAAATVDDAAHMAATSPKNDKREPTQAEKEAGNYPVGHLRVAGLDISIENPVGSVRRGTNKATGEKWQTTMRHHYGYIRGTVGLDKDHIDVFVVPGTTPAFDGDVYVVDQVDPKTGKLDEHKVILGARSAAQAREIYQANYSEGWRGLKNVTTMPMDRFKTWVRDPAATKKEAAKIAPQMKASAQRAVEDSLPPISSSEVRQIEGKTVKVNKLSKPVAKTLQQFAKVFGHRIEFFHDPEGSDGYVVEGDTTTIYLNTESSMPHLAVLGHEVMHQLKASNPKAYAIVEKVVRARLAEDADSKFAEDYGKGANTEELVSDLMGNRWLEPEFLAGVFRDIEAKAPKESKGIIDALAKAIRRAVEAMLVVLSGEKGFATDKYVKDLEGVRAALKTALTEYAVQRRNTPIEQPRDAIGRFTESPARKTQGDNPITVVGVHYSKQQRSILTSSSAGSNYLGAERERGATKDRIYFYVDTGQGVKPEAGVGGYAHQATLTNLYDAGVDPEYLGEDSKGLNDFEQRVIDAGYDGYFTPDFRADEGAAVLLGQRSVPVKFVGQGARPPGGARPQRATRQDTGWRAAAAAFRARKDLPAGEVAASRWPTIVRGLSEALYDQMADTGIWEDLSNSSDRLYKNDVLRMFKDAATGQDAKFSQKRPTDVTRRQVLIAAASAAASKANAETTLGRAVPIPAQVLDSQVSPAAAKILRGKGGTNIEGGKAIKAALLEIAANGPVELRPLAKQIANLMPPTSETPILLTVDDRTLAGVHGAVTLSTLPHLQLFTAGGRTGLSHDTVLHESLHLVVAARYRTLSSGVVRRNDSRFKLPAPNAAAALDQFVKVWDEFERAAKANKPKDKETQLAVDEAVARPDEFFVRALTDARLQAYMAGIEYEGTTLLQKFKDWVTGLFVKTGVRPSWLDAATTASSELAASMATDKPDFARLRASNELARRDSAKRRGGEDSNLGPRQYGDETVSSRNPTAKSSAENAMSERLNVGLGVVMRDPELQRLHAQVIGEDPIIGGFTSDDPRLVIERFVEALKDNLLMLWRAVPEKTRERSRGWYVGANRLSEELSAEAGIRRRTAAAVFALLSPQTPWDTNVSQGARVVRIWKNHANDTMDQPMRDWFDSKIALLTKNGKDPIVMQMIKDTLEGVRMRDLAKDRILQAWWVRAYDESHHVREYHLVSPEGGSAGLMLTKNGKGPPANMPWGNTLNIAKALTVLDSDGDMVVISRQLGKEHKVRSFYNNIIDPNSRDEHVTIDTHAVAAARLEPVAGTSVEVAQAWGGVGSSSIWGQNGLYGEYAEAYRRAAEEVDALPREMQSVTWEAVRGLFPDTFKSKESRLAIKNIWKGYARGEYSLAEARRRIVAATPAKGITPPNWERGDGSDTAAAGRTGDGRKPSALTVRTRGSAGGERAALESPKRPDAETIETRKRVAVLSRLLECLRS